MTIFWLFISLILFLGCGALQASVYLTPSQAIQAAFPAAIIERKTAFLSAAQRQAIESVARVKLNSSITNYYVARSSAGVTGIAFFDRRIVRTMPVMYMVVVQPSGIVERVEILSFEEPQDYLPPLRWLQLYRNHALNNDLAIGRDIPHITGASLSSQAMNDGVRLILAIYQVAVKDTL